MHTKEHLSWKSHKDKCDAIADFSIVSFNLLAPCYKRLHGTRDHSTGRRLRESGNRSLWLDRAGVCTLCKNPLHLIYLYSLLSCYTITEKTLRFLRKNLLGSNGAVEASQPVAIIAFQEYWLNYEYTAMYDSDFKNHGYEIRHLQRSSVMSFPLARF